MTNLTNLLNVTLEDDNTATGGVSFPGQTVRDFLEETGISEDTSIKELNEALEQCGIKPLQTTLDKVIDGLYAGELNTVQKDVLTWLAGSEAETLEDAINLLENVQCENADVSHLVYNKDISAWVYEHEESILEIINGLVGTDLHDLDEINWAQHDDLASVLTEWESGHDRYYLWVDDTREEAEELAHDDNEDWEEMDEEEKEDAINEALDVLFYQYDVFELTNTNKMELAWLAFEYEAQNLAEELEGIREVIAGE